MNFAAQLFYSSYLSERLERLYSPRPAIKDSEENDPFWQRWENTASCPLDSPDISPDQLSPVVKDLTSVRSSVMPPTSADSMSLPSVTSSSHHPPLSLQSTPTNTPVNLQSSPPPPSPHLYHKGKSTQPPTCLPNPRLAAAVPKSKTYEPSSYLSLKRVCTKPSSAPKQRSQAETASLSSISQSSSSSSSSTPSPCRRKLQPTFQALVDLLLRFVLYLILLVIPR